MKVEKPPLAKLARAAFKKDVDQVEKILDATFNFGGILGDLVEKIDGPVVRAVAEWLVEYGPEFAEELMKLAKQD